MKANLIWERSTVMESIAGPLETHTKATSVETIEKASDTIDGPKEDSTEDSGAAIE